ncbi:B12-binding domain-containing radical SAM protein [Magnetovibrio sp.]|uniref:B12-binding domain-containing radical SAM protein n=1 Tax=Magnetovibrio sp. TaxID=2024836 RepID=UPI002F93A233
MQTNTKSAPGAPAPFKPTVQAPVTQPRTETRLEISALDQALAYYRNGDSQKASASCWRVIGPSLSQGAKPKKKPGKDEQAYVYFILAQAFFAERDYESAKSAVSRSLALNKNNPGAQVLLARALERLDALDDALTAARKAVALAPRLLDGYEALADTLLEAGYPDDALRVCDDAVAALPMHPLAHAFKGRILRHVCDDVAALACHARALELGPPDPAAILAAMGHIHHDRGDVDEALACYTRALASRPHMLDAWHGRINTLVTAGRRDEAIAQYKHATQTVPGYQSKYFDFLHPLFAEPLAPRETLAENEPAPKQVALVNVIATFPSLPLGPALIKANVEKKSDFKVKCFDLNPMWFSAIVDSQRNKTAAFHYDDSDQCVAAADLFTHGGDGFFDDSVHNPLAETFSRYQSLISDAYNAQCQYIYETNGPAPWYVDQFARHILASNPAVVALSVMFTQQFWFSALLARRIKEINPRVLTVFGGGFFNEVNLQGFITRAYVDHVIVHEGELAFLEFLRAIDAGDGTAKGLEMITGLARFDTESGRTLIGQSLEKLNHEDLPFADFSDFDLDGYLTPSPVVPLISSRGCYWRRCTFCDHFASYAGSYKTQSISRCVAEIEHHNKTIGARHFTFVDEMISAKRFQKIGDEILERGLDIRYFALAKPTADFTQDILDHMYKTGCRSIYWGMESGSERLLAMMDKGNTVESSSNTLNRAHKAGIHNHLFIIVGFPSETREELEQTVAFLDEHADVIDKILASGYVLKKGTPIHDQLDRFGIKKIYTERSLCNSKILRYDSAKGLDSTLIHPMADYLQAKVFDLISPRGPYFGTPRNHIIIVYGNDDLAVLENNKNRPSLEEISRELDAITPTSKFLPTQNMTPIWNS